MTSADVPAWLEPLATALQSPNLVERAVVLRPGVGARAAAVLVLLWEGPSGPELMFVERAATMRKHASQMAFPGGAADADDADLVATALREAQEETGVPPETVEVLGLLPPAHVAVSGFDVTAVVGWWRAPTALAPADPSEVAAVHVVPVAALTDPAQRASVRHPSGYTGPAFEVDSHLVWGLTGHLLDAVLELGGWQRPWDAERRVAIPARYLSTVGDPARPETGGPDEH